MANQWLRLWHDMPTDPKWRTVAKVSGQRIGDVMAVYLHLLVCASNATERGRTHSFNCEDVASALDIETEQVALIVDAMQGRVLDGDMVAGWEKRQSAREDGSAERAKAWREAQKASKNADRTQANAAERNQTPDKDKSREEEKEEPNGSVARGDRYPACPHDEIVSLYHEVLPSLPRVRLTTEPRKRALKAFWGWVFTSKKSDGNPRAVTVDQALTWIRGYFDRANSNDFLMGRGHRSNDHANWQCDFDFLLTEKGKKHVIEKTKEPA
jgi:hypothetical protein